MGQVLVDHGLTRLKPVADWPTRPAPSPPARSGSPCSASRTGFETDELAVIGEQDILGDRLVRRTDASAAPADFLADVTSLAEGDLVVHIDHGIGRFVGLKTIEAAGAPHDCLEIHYAGNDRSTCRSRTSSFCRATAPRRPTSALDKLGGVAWQARKARMKRRLRDMADALIRIAAAARRCAARRC